MLHLAHLVRSESLAAFTAEMLYISVGDEVNMRIFETLAPAQLWLREMAGSPPAAKPSRFAQPVPTLRKATWPPGPYFAYL